MESEQKATSNEPISAQTAVSFFLTEEQAAFITTKLPPRYSLQHHVKPPKRPGIVNPASLVKLSRKRNHSKLEDSQRSEEQLRRATLQHSTEDLPCPAHSNGAPAAENNASALEDFDLEPEMASCFYILTKLKTYECAEPFLQAVDPVALGVPDYFKIVKEPMDLGLMERHIRAGQYSTPTQFHADMVKIFSNSYRYNAKGTDVYKLTVELQRHYKKLLTQQGHRQNSNQLYNRLCYTNRKVGELMATHAPKKRKKHNQPERILCEVEIMNLSAKLKALPNYCMAEILKLVTETRTTGGQPIRNILDTDLRELQMVVLLQIDRYVKCKMSPTVRRRKPERVHPDDRSPSTGKVEVCKPPQMSYEQSSQMDSD